MAKTGAYLKHAYMQGKVLPYSQAVVPISTSALQYGIGCFAGIRGYKQADSSIGIFRLEDHAHRLMQSADMLKFSVDVNEEKIISQIRELTKLNQPTSDIYIRPFFYKSDTNLGPSLTGDYDLGIYMLELDEYLDTNGGLTAGISSWLRVPDHAIPARSKASGVYINAALAIQEASDNGFDTAIMLDHLGNITEGSVMNLFIVKNNQLITPTIGGDLLEGITRRSVIELAHKNDINVVERAVRRSELYNCDEAFFTGTATELAWIKSIDHRPVSTKPGHITSKLKQDFQDVIHKDHELKAQWLDIVKIDG